MLLQTRHIESHGLQIHAIGFLIRAFCFCELCVKLCNLAFKFFGLYLFIVIQGLSFFNKFSLKGKMIQINLYFCAAHENYRTNKTTHS
jgi:hypothetical protein